MKSFDLYFALGLISTIFIVILIFRHFIVNLPEGVTGAFKLVFFLVGFAVIITSIGILTNACTSMRAFSMLKEFDAAKIPKGSENYLMFLSDYTSHLKLAKQFIVADIFMFALYFSTLLLIRKASEKAYRNVKNRWKTATIDKVYK